MKPRWMHRAPVVAALFVAGSLFPAPDARASCGAESCALDNFGSRARRLSFELSFQTVEQDRVQIGTRDARVGEISGHHDEVESRSRQVTLKGQLSLTPRWYLTASVPYLDRVHRHIANETGLFPVLQTWTYRGVGDGTLLANWTALGTGDPSSPLTVVLQAGAKLPTGARHIESVDGEQPEPHARLGTGSWDVLVGGHAMRFVNVPVLFGGTSPLPIYTSLMYMHTTHGTDNYRVGRMLDATAGVSYPVASRLRLLSQLNLRKRGHDDPGVPHGEDGGHVHLVESLQHGTPEEAHEVFTNTGGVALYATPGLRFEAGPLLSLSAYLQVPLYQKVNGIQLVAPYHFWLGANYKLP